MSDVAASPRLILPERPSLEHLKNQARRRLGVLRADAPDAKLADAQLQIARDYGFAGWRMLKEHVEAQARPAGRFANFVGFYRHDPLVMSNAVVGIGTVGGRLVLRAINGSDFMLIERGGGRFTLAGTPGTFSFEGGDHGPATALISQAEAHVARMERIDEPLAQALIAARRQAEEEQARPRSAIELAPALLERLVGHFALPNGPVLETSVRQGRLFARVSGQPAVEISPETETDFFYRILPAQLAFELQGAQAIAVVLHQNGLAQRMMRITAEAAEALSATIRNRLSEQQQPRTRVQASPKALARCAGRYKLDGERMITVQAEGAHLFVEVTGQPRLEVYPESETRFFWTVVAAQLSFAIEPGQPRATHAVLHQNGRDFPLPRIDDDGGPDA